MADYYCESPLPSPFLLRDLAWGGSFWLGKLGVPGGGLQEKRIGQSMVCDCYG